MRSIAFLLLVVTLGCGPSRVGSDYQDKAAVKEQFISVVRECYRERGDGTLREPVIDTERVRFVFQYVKEVDDAEAEWIDLTFSKQGSRRMYRVLVYQPLQGPNRVLDEQTRRVAAMLQERVKPGA